MFNQSMFDFSSISVEEHLKQNRSIRLGSQKLDKVEYNQDFSFRSI